MKAVIYARYSSDNRSQFQKMIKEVSIILSTLLLLSFLIYTVVEFDFLVKEDVEFIAEVNRAAIYANILIIDVTTQIESEHLTTVTYSEGQSGVIFQKNDKKYYVLTALHGIPIDSSDMSLIILGYDQLKYEWGFNVGQTEYYSQFPRAILEYYDEAYDLAVISFYSENEYTVLPIASATPERNQAVAAMSNPHNYKRNNVTTGRIRSRNPVSFGDTAGRNQHNIIEHTARLSQGSSGGALINKNMEIAGINLGASEFFGEFLKGKAMPSDRILDFLADMDNQ